MQDSAANRLWIALAAISGLAAVALGAWSAHGLTGPTAAQDARWIDTGLTYHMLHVAGLLAVGLLPRPALWRHLAGGGFLGGTLFFSGGLYLRALAGADLGWLIPLGGLLYMTGWLALLLYALTGKDRAHGG